MPSDLKNMISDRFLALLSQRGQEKVSVRQLVEACSISRQTFYYYFRDIFDVAEWGLQRDLDRLAEECLSMDDREQALAHFAAQAGEHLVQLQGILSTKYRLEMEAILLNGVRRFFRQIMDRSQEQSRLDPGERDLFAEFFACGITKYLVERSYDRTYDPAAFASFVQRLLDAGVNGPADAGSGGMKL